MRALRVIGLEADGKSLVCEDTESQEKFSLVVDDKLRAAARGELTPQGKADTDRQSQLRPRDIQTRIRAGATLEEVASAAGVPVSRIERFAYPVLLERSRAAEVAQEGHPVRPDGPAVLTLVEIVADAMQQRGQDLANATWDAWRGEDSRWVVQLRWTTGRSDNRAHWRFQPGAHGGTIVALDDPAADLIDPNPTRPLRTIPTVSEAAEAVAEPAVKPVADPAPAPTAEVTVEVDVEVEQAPEQPAQEQAPAAPVAERAPRPKQSKAATSRKDRQKAAVPSWEDVLLGVRSQRG
ncbi:septation protein SepH [Rhodococcus sp. X156]|uniref:septation protein SepH n=1 Tax=Rhodococcus sp. X156 TaxID=2499145 RepID=UPI000FDC2388|nr:septation protein SepH [Rhodococcus sp. X156]